MSRARSPESWLSVWPSLRLRRDPLCTFWIRGQLGHFSSAHVLLPSPSRGAAWCTLATGAPNTSTLLGWHSKGPPYARVTVWGASSCRGSLLPVGGVATLRPWAGFFSCSNVIAPVLGDVGNVLLFKLFHVSLCDLGAAPTALGWRDFIPRCHPCVPPPQTQPRK